MSVFCIEEMETYLPEGDFFPRLQDSTQKKSFLCSQIISVLKALRLCAHSKNDHLITARNQGFINMKLVCQN